MFYPIKNGTKITVGEGFQCWIPPIPDKSQIVGYDLPREEQYWKREPIPKWYLERSLEEEYRQQQEQELILSGKKKFVYVDPMCERYRRLVWYRRNWGMWFMNDGEPTYITNDHYYYLQWCKADHPDNNGYPLFYEFSRDNFYIRKWCSVNPRSLGYMMIGPRGTGKSAEEIACITNNATRFHNHRVALQGKHFEDDSKKIMIQGKLVPLFNALPSFLKPEFAHGTDPQEQLIFKMIAVKGKESRNYKYNPDAELNSVMFAAMPGEKALDGETMNEIFESEIGKTNPKKVANIHTRHGVNVKCVFRNHRKIGLLRKESTVEEMDEGGDECARLYKESDAKFTDGNGWTISKIHRHLISALDTDTSLEHYIDSVGKDWGAPCNKYGKVNRTLANIKIQNDLDAVKHDLKELSSRMRKSPRNASEAFIKDQSKSIFNVMLLTQRLEEIRNMARPPYVRGNLYWVKEKFGKVWWQRDDHAGRFKFAWFPDEYSGSADPDKMKILNNVGEEWGYDKFGASRKMLYPKNDHLFRIGTDPIKYKKTTDPRASKAAMHGFRLFDAIADYGKSKHDWSSHNFIFEYINRPDDPRTSFEDAAMACIFLGCKILPENNIPHLNEYFESNGLERFLGYPKDFIWTTTGPKKIDENKKEEIERVIPNFQIQSEDGGYSSTPEVIDFYIGRIITFINEHIHRMPFDDTVESWLGFDPKDPTKYDATISSGFTLVHAEKKAENPEEKAGLSVSDFFDGYTNSGVNAQLVTTDD